MKETTIDIRTAVRLVYSESTGNACLDQYGHRTENYVKWLEERTFSEVKRNADRKESAPASQTKSFINLQPGK